MSVIFCRNSASLIALISNGFSKFTSAEKVFNKGK